MIKSINVKIEAHSKYPKSFFFLTKCLTDLEVRNFDIIFLAISEKIYERLIGIPISYSNRFLFSGSTIMKRRTWSNIYIHVQQVHQVQHDEEKPAEYKSFTEGMRIFLFHRF